jgi:hypothetical protein
MLNVIDKTLPILWQKSNPKPHHRNLGPVPGVMGKCLGNTEGWMVHGFEVWAEYSYNLCVDAFAGECLLGGHKPIYERNLTIHSGSAQCD